MVLFSMELELVDRSARAPRPNTGRVGTGVQSPTSAVPICTSETLNLPEVMCFSCRSFRRWFESWNCAGTRRTVPIQLITIELVGTLGAQSTAVCG
jgi:hypothetical protein